MKIWKVLLWPLAEVRVYLTALCAQLLAAGVPIPMLYSFPWVDCCRRRGKIPACFLYLLREMGEW